MSNSQVLFLANGKFVEFVIEVPSLMEFHQ